MTNKNIFVACDVSSKKVILDLLELIHDDISGIKIGLQYITQRSPEEIRELSKFKKPIFYDGKFFDIKNTLVESVKSLENLNVNYATVHLLNGLDALKAANKAAQEINLHLLGVSILTSFTTEDLETLKQTIHNFVFDILGLVNVTKADDSSDKLSGAVELLIQLRQEARANKDFALSDKIRDELAAAGIQLNDGKEGTTFTTN